MSTIVDHYQIWGPNADVVYTTTDRQDAVDTFDWLFGGDPDYDVVRIFERVERPGWRICEWLCPISDDGPIRKDIP